MSVTTGSYPDYHKHPLRLTNDEIANPQSIIDDFFRGYHLPEIRDDLQIWLEDSMTNLHSQSKDHFFTHQKVEKLIEASWIIYTTPPVKTTPTGSQPFSIPFLGKDAKIFEFINCKPVYVINEVYKSYTLKTLHSFIRDWSHVAIATSCSAYHDSSSRNQFQQFAKRLHSLVEAIYIVHCDDLVPGPENQLKYYPLGVGTNFKTEIVNFFEEFPLLYCKRELYDWLEAGLSFRDIWPADFSLGNVLDAYKVFWCLVESSYNLMNYSEDDLPL